MDSVLSSASIAAAAVSFVSLILNVVILRKLTGLKTAQRQPVDATPRRQDSSPQRRPQQQDRKSGRPQDSDQSARQRPPQQVSTTESSLRDINLRLKNAEKFQERARQEVREVTGGPSSTQDRQGGQNQGRRDRGPRGRRRGRNRPHGNRPDRDSSAPQGNGYQRPSDNGESDFRRRELGNVSEQTPSPESQPAQHEPAPGLSTQETPVVQEQHIQPVETPRETTREAPREEPQQARVEVAEKAPEQQSDSQQQEAAPAAPVFGRR